MLTRYSKHYKVIIALYLTGVLSAIFAYRFFHRLKNKSDIVSIAQILWSYPVFTKDNSSITVGMLTTGVALIILGYYLSKHISKLLAERVFKRFNLAVGAIASLETLSFYILLAFFTLFALNVANVPLTMFTVVGGALAIGIGFGSQNLMNNFISGIILQIEHPVKVGDFIEIDGSKGVIKHIGARSTTINSVNGSTFVIPNSNFLEKRVQNYSLFSQKIKTEIKIILSPSIDIYALKNHIEDFVIRQDEIVSIPNPTLLFVGYTDAGNIIMSVNCWIDLLKTKDRSEFESRVLYEAYSFIRKNKT